MARTKTKAPDVVDIQMNGEALTAAQNRAVERTGAIIAQFGDGVPFEVVRYEHIIRGHLSRSAEEMLAAGRKLIVAKEHLAHGEWQQFLGRIGIDVTLAKRMAQAAFKFSNGATSHHLIEAAGNKSKLFELLVLDDEEIEELSDGGTVAGLELDDVARLSVSELRKALRERNEEDKAKDQLLSQKNVKIDNLTAEIQKSRTRLEQATVDERLTQAMADLSATALAIQADIAVTLRSAIEQLLGLQPEAEATIAGHVTQIQQAVTSVCTELAIGTVVINPPAWAQE